MRELQILIKNIYKIETIYLDNKWKSNINISTDNYGKIVEVSSQEKYSMELKGIYLPTFMNSHSHAFQYTLVGKGELFKGGKEDFWSWRNEMYKIALTISPEKLFKVARILYNEMIKNGYDSVIEFHYLHHNPDGVPYDDITEMSKSLILAAEEVGISLVLCPVYYNSADFGRKGSSNQRRFLFKSPDKYLNLLSSLIPLTKIHTNLTILPGVHSLRACPEDHLTEIYKCTKGDFHIHISEQEKEVKSCQKFYGSRPVQWLFNKVDNHQRLQLVHATHLSKTEIEIITESGANVILCPTTEANLGDGIFRLSDYVSRGGKFSIGSDSHISLSPFDELRCLDFSQRLLSQSRSESIGCFSGEMGEFLYDSVDSSRSIRKYNTIQNLIKINEAHPLIDRDSKNKILSTLICAYDRQFIEDIFILESGKFISTKKNNFINDNSSI